MGGRIVRLGLLFGLAAALASPAFAFNLLNNPHFNGSLAGWNTAPDVAYDPATGTVGSGSARSTFIASSGSTQEVIDQCIATGPGSYTLGGKVLIPSGQTVGGQGLVTVSFFSGGDCVTGLLGSSFLSTSTTGSFQTLSSPVTAPAGTAHIWVTGQNNASAAGTHVVNFDDFVLDNGVTLPEPTINLPALGPLGLLALLAALAAVGFLVLRR